MSETATTTPADGSDRTHELPVGVDGETVPAQEIVTGRGFVTGKSGSGKSNSVTVLLEELLELGLPALVVDIDGEYYPLKDRFDVLHVGGDADCDTIVDESDADRLADLALGDGVPIVLDVSAFASDDAHALIDAVVRALFTRAKRERRPYLLVVEEIHEYLPQSGSDDLAELLTTVAKRGRKHGLGILGASQRPSSVDKDFITQANWMVWHRLTYETDTKKAGKNLGKGYEDPISALDDGEAYVQADFLETVETLQFRKKHVQDAGATPDIAPYVDTPTAHDTDVLLERLGPIDDAGETAGDETARDGAAGDSECNGECEPADRLRERVDALERELRDAERDRVRGEYHQRAAERLAVDVVDLRERLEETRDELEVCRVTGHAVPDDLDLPNRVTPIDAANAVADAETVFDVQQELRIQRRDAREIVNAFDEMASMKQADGSHQAENNILEPNYTGETDKVTARVPKPLIRTAERTVEAGEYPSKAEMFREGFRTVVEATDAYQNEQ